MESKWRVPSDNNGGELMKITKNYILVFLMLFLSAVIFCGCGGSSVNNVSGTSAENSAVTNSKDLAISNIEAYVGTHYDIPVTIKLNTAVNFLNGGAFTVKYNPDELRIHESIGSGGVELNPSLGNNLLLVKNRAGGYLDIGFTLKDNAVNVQGELAIIHFTINPVLPPGTYCKIEIDSTTKKPEFCLKDGKSFFRKQLTSETGYVVIK